MNLALDTALNNFQVKNNELLVKGRSLKDIVAQYKTPLYLYDTDVLQKRQIELRQSIPAEILIYYAVKANPNIEILKHIHKLYDGVDIASLGEMKNALTAGLAGSVMSFAGPGKNEDELRYAVQNKIGSISVENEQELDWIEQNGKREKSVTGIMLRVNPSFDLTSSGMKMGGGPKQFGIDSEKIPQLIREINSGKNAELQGIHIYAGSQILDADTLVKGVEKILNYADTVQEDTGIIFKKINLGGGLGISYFANDQALDLPHLGKGLKQVIHKYQQKYPTTQLLMELGRYIVGDCGLYISKVLYKKISREHVFLIIDGGMHHHLAASGNFGQSLVRRPFPICVGNKVQGSLEKVTIAGPLCTPLDTFGTIELPGAEAGDLIVVFCSGAYGYSASPLAFLGHPPPLEVVL